MKKVRYTSRVQSHLEGGLNLHGESLDDWFSVLCLIEFPSERRKGKELKDCNTSSRRECAE